MFKCFSWRNFSYIYQFEFQDPKTMDVQYHIRPYVVGIYMHILYTLP